MDSFLIEIPCTVIASLTREEWQVVCEQLDALNEIYYTTTIAGQEVDIPIFSRMLDGCCSDVAFDQVA